MTAKSIIENIRMEVSKAENQTANTFSPYHVKYNVKIWYKGKKFQSNFQIPLKEASVILEDFLFCIFNDIATYENAKSLEDFNAELGYDTFDTFESDCTYKKGKKAYYKIEKQRKQIHDIFTDEEIKILNDYFSEYEL